MNTYTARVTHDEDAWMIEVPEVRRVTQALHLRQVETMARDLVSIMEDVPADSFELQIVWPEHIAKSLDDLRNRGMEAQSAAARVARARRETANLLRREGATVRDIGAIMGVSFQRAQQLLESSRRQSA